MQKILSGLAALLLVGAASAQPASLLVYRVAEQGGEPYISRIIVTPDFLRLDEGSDDASYTLFDRRQEILYNVSPDDHSILVLDVTEPVPGDKAGLNLQEQVDGDEQAPLVAGQRPTHVRLLANGDLCSELVVIKDTMNDAVAALSEMKTALARVQAATLNAMPLDRRTPCDMAMNVYAPARSLGFGLPLQERSEGRSQSLVDFSSDHEVDDALFALPEQFDRRPLFMPGTT